MLMHIQVEIGLYSKLSLVFLGIKIVVLVITETLEFDVGELNSNW